MTADERAPERKESKAGAGAAGAGAGTLLVVIANSLPNDHGLRPWLIYLAPSASAVMSLVWVWLQVEIGNWVQEKKLASLVAKAKDTYRDALQNPDTSDEHKNSIRSQLEELELIVSTRRLTQIRSLTPVRMEDLETDP